MLVSELCCLIELPLLVIYIYIGLFVWRKDLTFFFNLNSFCTPWEADLSHHQSTPIWARLIHFCLRSLVTMTVPKYYIITKQELYWQNASSGLITTSRHPKNSEFMHSMYSFWKYLVNVALRSDKEYFRYTLQMTSTDV